MTRWIPGLVGPRSPNATRLIRRCSDRRSGRPLSEARSLRFLPETKTDGVGFEPTNGFRRCRFSRSAKPLRALPKRTSRKTGTKRSWGRPRRAAETRSRRAKPRQTETRQAESRPLTRQVSDKSRPACLEMTRNVRESSAARPALLRQGRLGERHRRQVESPGSGLDRRRTPKG